MPAAPPEERRQRGAVVRTGNGDQGPDAVVVVEVGDGRQGRGRSDRDAGVEPAGGMAHQVDGPGVGPGDPRDGFEHAGRAMTDGGGGQRLHLVDSDLELNTPERALERLANAEEIAQLA